MKSSVNDRLIGIADTRTLEALLLAGAALLAFAPNPLASLLGFGTSEVEDIQQPTPEGMAGVSTAIPPRACTASVPPAYNRGAARRWSFGDTVSGGSGSARRA